MGGGVLFTLILRGVLSPFAHPLFTSMTGIGAGIAANSRNGARPPVLPCSAATGRGVPARGVEQLGVVLRRRRVPDRLPRRDGAAVRRDGDDRDLAAPPRAGRVAEQLPGFAQAGWIAPSEIQLLSSLAGRRGWRTAVRQRSGRAVEQAVVRYQAAVTDLAFLRDRIAKGAIGPMARQWHDEAVAEVIRARRRAVGHPEGAPVALRHHGGPPRPARLEPTTAPGAREPAAAVPPNLPPPSWPPPVSRSAGDRPAGPGASLTLARTGSRAAHADRSPRRPRGRRPSAAREPVTASGRDGNSQGACGAGRRGEHDRAYRRHSARRAPAERGEQR